MTVPASPRPMIPLLPYQRRDVESNARFCCSNWSRQIGKSFSKSLKRLLRGVARRRNQILLSAGMRQSKELMEKVRIHAQALGMALTQMEGETFYHEEDGRRFEFKSLEIQVPGGARIIALPANPLTARGYTGDVTFDEFAMHRWDREIWAALYPAVLRGGGEVDVCSTPKGKGNMFYRLMQNEAFERTTVTIHDAVRDGLDVGIEQIRSGMDDEELWRQEFLCEFLDEAVAFLTYEQITACQDGALPEPIRINGEQPGAMASLDSVIASIDALGECYLGYDVGRSRDLSVWWLCEKLGRELVTRMVVELARTRFTLQREYLWKILGQRRVRHIAIDHTGLGMQMAEETQERFGECRVDAIDFTMQSKQLMAGRLRTRVEDRSIRIPADGRVREDWHSIEKITTTGGSVLYRADRNDGHADRFWAAALCVTAAGDVAGGIAAESVKTAGTSSRFRGEEEGDDGRALNKRQMWAGV